MKARTESAAATSVATAEPEQPPARVVRRVQPRREDREQRERPVGVVQPVRRAVVAREQQEPEPDLRDEHCLREREQVSESEARARRAGTTRGPRSPRPT